jgi:tyrocidine synthetase-3
MKKNSFQDRVQESLQASSDNIAVRCGTQALTYNDLDRKSNCIAHWLLDKKINRETLIGILMNDRVRFIYTVIGILKAGCIFVSLDPAYPDSRLDLMINFTGTPLILTDKINQNRGRQTKFICIDDIFPGGEPGGNTPPVELSYSGEDPVYIYFTSGTTGTPKGILGKNKSLRHFIEWEVKTFAVDETFRVSQLTTPGFDAVLRDIFVPLFSGGCICIPQDPEILTDSEQFIRWVDSSGIRLLHCVPSLFRVLNAGAPALSPNHFKELKYVLLSGERIPPRELGRWYEIFDERIQLVNFWGPTETTMIKTFYFICKADVDKERIPIGKPMKGARVIIMDEAMKVCKERMAGNLYIRTPYQSFGYCNAPGLTHEKFIRNPFNNDPADLLYDTGDLGRLLPDGSIEFLGREDRQVKIMGIRVELEGIENVLLKYPSVDEAVVIKRDTPSASKPGEELLIAYITAKKNEAAKESLVEAVRTFLPGELPGYMVPPIILEIEKIPRKPNGKVDYDALPDPIKDKEKDYVAPVNDLQVKLSALWSEILKIEKISIRSNFFELGGNSLNLMALISKIHQEFDVRISLEIMFNNPTIEKLETVINKMEREQYFSIAPVEKKEYYILSPAQERLYFLHQMEKNSTVYNMPQVVSLDGEFNKEKLEEIFRKIIKRHESFRTTFEMLDGKPVQRVYEDRNLEFEISYWECSEAEAGDIVGKFFRPFDLGCAPLLRAGLIKTGDSRRILVVDLHHIITDGSSVTLLISEVMQRYRGEEPPALNVQYKDYAEWRPGENKWLKKQEEYWMQEYAEGIPVLTLPVDFPRPAVQDFKGNVLSFRIENEPAEKLKTLAASCRATLFMALAAVFNIFLAKISNQEDIVIGTGVEGRSHEDMRRIIGMFVNTLALRNYVQDEYSFLEFLEQVRYRVLRGLENQDYPFERLVEKLKLQRDTSRNPLFDVMFMLHNMEQPLVQIPHQDLPPFSGKIQRTSKFDLTFQVVETENGFLIGEFEYSTRLFLPITIERYAKYLQQTLGEILHNPWKKLAEIEIIPGEDKKHILNDFNDTKSEFPDDKVIQRLFEEQVVKSPGNSAVIFQDNTLTYSRLNTASDRLAAVLRERGVIADSIVAVMADRSLEMIIGIMGILKSGGAYMPIDPDYPPDRIDFMLKDSGAKILVTTGAMTEHVRAVRELPLKLITLEEVLSISTSTVTLTSTCQVAPANLAYVIYTSGTTGRPKGTLIDHRNVVRLMFNEKFQFDFSHRDIWTLYHSYCFDFSVWEMYGALLYGGKLIVVPRMVSIDSREFLSLLEKESVSVLNQTPSAFYNLIELNLNTPGERRRLNLKYIIFGGEALKPGKLESWRECYPGTKFINMFGITETTVHVTYKEINPDEIALNRSNIGKPIPTLVVYILDNRLKPVPVGVLGEIHVGGLGVGRGYLNRPELTSGKFIENPYREFDRLYRSGDLGRYIEEGEIEYLGRIDQQVKIRGFRIEPGEIENELLRHREIKGAVVIEKEKGLEKYLCAYIVSEKELETSGLRAFLAGNLPDYMIPAHFVQVEKIPLTTNGKVDVKSLDLLGKKLESGIAYTAPQNEIERKISETWKQVLGRPTLGIHENYFEVGGTSLEIVRICAQLKESFQMEIPVVAMFTYPTVHLFAEYIINTQQEKVEKIRDRSAVLEQSKTDRREQFRRRTGTDE